MQKLPSAIKEQRGTSRPDRGRENEPRLDVEEPPLPADLTEREKEVWAGMVDDLKRMGVLTRADGVSLKQLVVTSVECDRLRAMISGAETTSVTSTQKEVVDRVHPLYMTYISVRKELRALWTCFGLDPLARTSVHTVQKLAKGKAKNDGGDSPEVPAKPQGAARYFQH